VRRARRRLRQDARTNRARRRLVARHGRPAKTLVITFTRRAADELREYVCALADERAALR
jgi:superfamily I DNA/RNA helicase